MSLRIVEKPFGRNVVERFSETGLSFRALPQNILKFYRSIELLALALTEI